MDKLETRLLQEMSVSESLQMFGQLYEAYARRFGSEEADYLAERERILIARQERLERLANWLKDHPGESPLHGSIEASEKAR